jgi:hypothetical protein
LFVFDSRVLQHASLNGNNDWEDDYTTEQVYLNAGGESFGRVFYDDPFRRLSPSPAAAEEVARALGPVSELDELEEYDQLDVDLSKHDKLGVEQRGRGGHLRDLRPGSDLLHGHGRCPGLCREPWNQRGNTERRDARPISPFKRHGASRSKRDGRGEVAELAESLLSPASTRAEESAATAAPHAKNGSAAKKSR